MKKRVTALMIGAMAMMLVGCGAKKDDNSTTTTEVATEATNDAEVPENALPTITTGGADFDTFIEFMTTGLTNKWSETSPADLGLADVYKYNSPDLGYAKIDVNNDGMEELIFGENTGVNADSNDSFTIVYDVFTIDANGNCIHLASGGERDMFHISNGAFIELGSSGADDSVARGLKIQNGYLVEDSSIDVNGATFEQVQLTKFVQ